MDLDDLDDAILDELINNSLELKENDLPKETNSELTLSPPSPEHLKVLSKYFGHKTFKPLQWEIISSIINNKRDICAVMSTGYGKSLCFQYPSTFLGRLTLVISPLIALMEDQVLSLQVSNIPACLLGSSQKNQKQVIDDIFENKYSLVYLTPEFCCGDCGTDFLKKMSKKKSVVLIAVDEAHCISSWGHDFRFQYRQLNILREIFTTVPIIAVTATATSKVRTDIIRNLKLKNPLTVCSGFNRSNIYFEVYLKGSQGPYKDFTKAMIYENSGYKFMGPTIVYCITRKQTEEIAEILTSNGLKSRPYHAGLSIKQRSEAHELFVKDKIDIIVATIAFGMGIDKPDIRNVIHYGSSKSIESYYQEVGRAGRDGQPARCVTFYNRHDFTILRHLNSSFHGNEERKETNLKKMEEYLATLKCRRKYILDYFEDETGDMEKPRRLCCDNCDKKLRDSRSDHEKYEGVDENGFYDFTNYAHSFLNVVSLFDSRNFAINTYVSFLRGIKSSKFVESKRRNPLYGCGRGQSEAWWQAIGKILTQEKYLSEKNQRTQRGFSYLAISLTDKGRAMITNDEKLLLPPPSFVISLLKTKSRKEPVLLNTTPTNLQPSTSTVSIVDPSESQFEIEERKALYQKLLGERTDIARHLDCMPYMVASNAALMTMSKLKPQTLEDLSRLNIDGFTEAKIIKFGQKFLKVITGRSDTQPMNKKLPIKDLLVRHPLPNFSLSLTAQVSCTMLQSGLSVGEIATKRGVTAGTVASHILSGIKFGYPIKMIELGVTEECREVVITVFRKFCKTGFTSMKLKTMKEECPPEITYDQIGAVLAYLAVRYHLQALNLPYEEFEDFSFNDVKMEILEDGASQPTKNVEDDLDFIGTQACQDALTDEMVESCNSPSKKLKIDHEFPDEAKTEYDAILGSPPRQYNIEFSAPDVKSEISKGSSCSLLGAEDTAISNNVTKNSKKKVLPPWLIRKKVN